MASFYLSLRALRIIAIVAPVLFAVGVGLVTDRVLEPRMAEHWAYAIATAAIGVGAFVFAIFIFSLLSRTYRQLEEQKDQLERQARELQAATEEWKALFDLGQEVTASPDLEGLLDSIVSRAKSLLNTDVAALMLLSADGRTVHMATHSGLRTAGMRTLRLVREHGLQGLVLETGSPIIVVDYQTDDRLVNRPAGLVKEEGLVSLICVPFSGKEGPLGTLTVGNRRKTRFNARQAELLQAFANWAAVATETSELYEKSESLARLEERERIGMDLHDGVIQSIYAVGLNLEDCAERVVDSPQEVRAGLEKAMDDLNRVIKDIRSYIFDLRTQVSQVADLPVAIRELVRDVRVNTLMEAEVDIRGDLLELLDPKQALALFHIAQEALNNVSRHSGATVVKVQLVGNDEQVRLEIADNGVGFDLSERVDRAKNGMRNMTDRARSLGAELKLESQPNQGTRVAVELSLAKVRG